MANEQQNEQYDDGQLVDDSQLDEQVENALGEFEEAANENDVVYDESEESAELEAGESEDETVPPVEDSRIGQMSDQLGQMKDLVGHLMQQLNAKDAAAQQEQSLEDISAPAEVEEYTQQDAVGYAMKQAHTQTQQAIGSAMQQVQKPISLHNNVLNTLLTGHPKEDVIRQAITYAGNGMPWQQAIQTAEGLAAGQVNKKLSKENEQFKRTSRKRSRKASRGQKRPSGNPNVKVKDNSHSAAAERIWKQLNGALE